MLLSTAFFPPTDFFALKRLSFQSGELFLLEACESYEKQSYRNRCRILTSNGVMDLRVPIVHDGARLITDIAVDYSRPWVRQMEYAIETAYCSSPFFEYYKDPLFAILDSKPERLWDLNLRLIRFFSDKIGLAGEMAVTSDYCPSVPNDYRRSLHPKKPSVVDAKPYWQVFNEKFGFVGGLSIMDLLFNEGPESICYL